MFNRKKLARLAGAGAAATVAMGLFSTGAANADTFVPLPGGEIVKTLSDGTMVTVRLVGESATISPSMGSTPLHRNAWVSGSAQVEIAGGNAEGGRIRPGYVVGCQVNISGGGASGGVEGSVDWSNGESVVPGVGANTGGELTLGPGQAKSFHLLDLEGPDDYGDEDHKTGNRFNGNSGSVTWSDSTIGLTGCGGYAQARAFVSVSVETEHVRSTVTLWGQPFSLG
ncbi:MspA family porin [Nocardia donostiensis]|uniref:Porin n=1 Tax=Nocardia donostiensis TaxID=1538463 RepID=A0A1V2TFR9_9NOCA|nr:MspA family porin [Nocardia donostiensis]ONM48334.1 porin [Nocardia donostiensis]OQS14474.1 porin [Nocardia donostiensis]OQS20557.1 porin [Nocardia donostiensis]